MAQRGFFIAVDGPDGAGKSTLIKKITEILQFICPDDTTYSAVALSNSDINTAFYKRMKARKLDELTEILGFAVSLTEASYDYLARVLGYGHVVILDRWVSSFYAYQHTGRDRTELTGVIYKEVLSKLQIPDLYIYCRVEQEVADRRMVDRGDQTYLDKETALFKERVRAGYDEYFDMMKDKFRYSIVLDCNAPLKDVFAQLETELRIIMSDRELQFRYNKETQE